jgi:pimeloyl-ACP methyl ester carboxylesterase
MSSRFRVILLPGGVLPAELAYSALLEALGERVEAVTKDLEVYAGEELPAAYGLGEEIEGIRRLADSQPFERFHLVGYSGGGASSLSFTAMYPERLLSLALLEPAWAGNTDLSREELALRQQFEEAAAVESPDLFMREFVRLQLRPGVAPPPPPPEPLPPWMAKRPAGLRALMRAFNEGELDLGRLRSFRQPVYFALGGKSNPDYYERMAERLGRVFPNFTLERFEERHHFDPPHRLEAQRLAASLLRLWQRAESADQRPPAP